MKRSILKGFLLVSGILLLGGCGERKLKAIQRQARSGDASAQYTLAVMYGRGDCVEQDLEQAFAWMTRSAQQGNKTAQFALGTLFYAENDLVSARLWWKKSAAQGYDPAKTFLEKYGE